MVSIICPVYEMKGRGVFMLTELIDSIYEQDYEDIQIIVSDNSHDLEISDFCKYQENIKYLRNEKKESPAANFNNAMNHATGEIIKPMCQDDFFTDPGSITKIVQQFDLYAKWVVCASSDHSPYFNGNIKRLREGENTYGSPSAVAWKRNDLRFDENLMWLMDCEFYSRMITEFGQPVLIPAVTIGIRKWDGQLTWDLSNRRITDLEYVHKKYHA